MPEGSEFQNDPLLILANSINLSAVASTLRWQYQTLSWPCRDYGKPLGLCSSSLRSSGTAPVMRRSAYGNSWFKTPMDIFCVYKPISDAVLSQQIDSPSGWHGGVDPEATLGDTDRGPLGKFTELVSMIVNREARNIPWD